MNNILQYFPELDTPALLIEKRIMEHNIERMQAIADSAGIKLRPHVKTHKMPALAKLQLAAGAEGIAVAKLSEAEVMARNGIEDIQIANHIVGDIKLKKLCSLSRKIRRLSCLVDSEREITGISKAISVYGGKIDIYIEIDSGQGRCGLSDKIKILALCRLISQLKNIRLAGITTHSGNSYLAKDKESLENIAFHEIRLMVETADFLRSEGIEINEIITGSTPTAGYSGRITGITGLRVGNYIFNDIIQVSLGVAELADCALTVISSVISNPASDRAIIDCGSKELTLDKGALPENINGYGKILNKNACLTRLSEEHGIIEYNNEQFSIGERIRIIPNHACVVCNQFDKAYLVDSTNIIEPIPIEARGKME